MFVSVWDGGGGVVGDFRSKGGRQSRILNSYLNKNPINRNFNSSEN